MKAEEEDGSREQKVTMRPLNPKIPVQRKDMKRRPRGGGKALR